MTSHPNRGKIRNWPEHLRAFRSRHALSQKQLADKLMISARLIENWEAEINSPPPYLKMALTKLEAELQ